MLDFSIIIDPAIIIATSLCFQCNGYSLRSSYLLSSTNCPIRWSQNLKGETAKMHAGLSKVNIFMMVQTVATVTHAFTEADRFHIGWVLWSEYGHHVPVTHAVSIKLGITSACDG